MTLMNYLFYISSIITIIAALLVVTRTNAIHGLLYLILTLFGIAMIFVSLGAFFAAALEIIIYAGAIMVLFVFVIMLINPGAEGTVHEYLRFRPGMLIGPGVLGGILLVELIYVIAKGTVGTVAAGQIGPKQVSLSLFGPYILGVEIASILLLAGLVGAYHLGRRKSKEANR
jgi:NADH-quinone oxidoreductase subunit J